jgi:hypothetical protein
MASPHVAGAAALYIAANGRASDATGVAAIRQALIDSGQPQSEWRGGASTDDPDGNPEPLVYVANFAAPAPVTDVAVTDVSAPSSVVQGETVDVSVTVKNVGNQAVESFDVTLTDDTEMATIGTQPVGGLAAGASATLTFKWATTESTTTGSHTLKASQLCRRQRHERCDVGHDRGDRDGLDDARGGPRRLEHQPGRELDRDRHDHDP